MSRAINHACWATIPSIWPRRSSTSLYGGRKTTKLLPSSEELLRENVFQSRESVDQSFAWNQKGRNFPQDSRQNWSNQRLQHVSDPRQCLVLHKECMYLCRVDRSPGYLKTRILANSIPWCWMQVLYHKSSDFTTGSWHGIPGMCTSSVRRINHAFPNHHNSMHRH